MWCDVYPIRCEGARLGREEIRAGGRRGWLTLLRMPAGQPVLQACLVDETGSAVFTGLTSAQVKTIDRGGILISGFLDTIAAMPTPQSWWCVPCMTDVPLAAPQRHRPERGANLPKVRA